MSAARLLARLGAVLAVPVLAAGAVQVVAATPASAHGALNNPVSRVYACSPEGHAARTAACRAAIAASAPGAFAEWDNLRVPDVNGRDRQLIPDGQLCSGGLAAYHGLDLARADWPTTTLTAGARYTFTYRTTIPHAGSFRMYVTRDGYDPTRPLRWSDLESTPFLTVRNPRIAGGAYVMPGRLPADKAGRQLIYTIWQTTSTPDTYYSCSDVVFTGAAAGTAAGALPATGAGPASGAPAATAAPTAGTGDTGTVSGLQSRPAAAVPLARNSGEQRGVLSRAALVGGTVVALGLAGAFLWRRRRPSRY